MFGRGKPEVLIVGAGPVGLFAGLVLARRGIRVRIVDERSRTGMHSYALALHRRSLQLLDEVGLLPSVLEQSYSIERIGLYDGAKRRMEVELSGSEQGLRPLVVMPQAGFESVLEQALEAQGVKVLWDHAVSNLEIHDTHVSATIDKMVQESLGYAVAHTEWIVAKSTRIDVPFVVGADGHRSFVRRALELDYPEVRPAEHFAVFEFQTDIDLEHELRLVLGKDTTNVLWPLPGRRCRWSFQLTDFMAPESTRRKDRLGVLLAASQYPVMSVEDLRSFLDERAPWFDSKIEELEWQIVVKFERRLASAFGGQRLWLAGDAAHLSGPVGGHGMNVGLREARELGAALAGILREGEGTQRLDAYTRERLDEWRFLLGVEGGLEPEPSTTLWIRENRERLLPCLPATGNDLAVVCRQLGLNVAMPGSGGQS